MVQKICVSFDYENDRNYYYMLKAWSNNPMFEFSFIDCTPKEIQSEQIDRIKAVLTNKISESAGLLVIVGEESSRHHPDYAAIGYINWQSYEIAKAKDLGKTIIAVKIQKEYVSPPELLNSGASWAMDFSEDAILRALKNG